MQILEFKAWLEGFEEAINGKPTSEQWKKIKKKLSEVTDSGTPYIYYRPLYPSWYSIPGTITTPTISPPYTVTCYGNSIYMASEQGIS